MRVSCIVSSDADDGPGGISIAIIGTGPRGIAVLEALAVELLGDVDYPPIQIWLIDSSELGAGRVWRTDQSSWFLMNTIVGEISMFSGRHDGGVCRPGAGCSFQEWLRGQDDPELSQLGHDDYAPRFAYGKYLKHVYKSILSSLEGRVQVTEILGQVTAIGVKGDHYRVQGLTSHGAFNVDVDAAVLTTGHSRTTLAPDQARLAAIADREPSLQYIPGDSAADLDLDGISSQSSVGIMGLGLSFYDILMSFTVGRGGEFKQAAKGTFCYIPNGREPRLVAGSRSGLPLRSRGCNQKTVRSRSSPRFFTSAAIARLREDAQRNRGTPSLDFNRDLLPLLHAELNYVYYTTQAAKKYGAGHARAIGNELSTAGIHHPMRWREIAIQHQLDESEPLDFQQLSQPFRSARFESPEEFTSALEETLLHDIRNAKQGNVNGPLKAAIDTIRDLRDILKYAVDFGGLTPNSHRDDFLRRFAPVVSLLSTGPPFQRTAQFLALIDAGILKIVGPDASFGFDQLRREFFVESPRVAHSREYISTIIDSRIPAPNLLNDTNPLMRQLVADGIVSEFINRGDDDSSFGTGALRVTPAEYRVVRPNGTPHRALYALGIPTEGIRWFTQIGNGRPGVRTTFLYDAKVVALSILRRGPQQDPSKHR